MAAQRLLDASDEVFVAERRRIERAVGQAVDAGELSPEKALSFCTQLDAVVRLQRHLETLVRGGQAAGKRLAPALDGIPNSGRAESSP